MSRKLQFLFATSLLTAGAVLLACAGSSDDASKDGAGALSGASRKAGTAAAASDAGGLTVTGDSMFIGGAVLINDQTLNDDGTQTPTARIIFSSRTGICDRISQGLTLAADEKMFSVRVKQPAFSAGKTTFTSDTSKSACVYVDNDLICGESTTASPTGTGTLDVSKVSASSVAGSVDITVGARRLQGPFIASACPSGKITNNRVTCGRVVPVSEDSTEDDAGTNGPTSGDPPAPSSTASR